MAADLHQAQLLFPPTASPPPRAAAPLFLSSSSSGSDLTSPSDSTSTEGEGKEHTAELTPRMMAQYDDHLYFQQSGSSDWHQQQPYYNHLSSVCCPTVDRQRQLVQIRGRLDEEVPHDIIDRFEKMSLVAKKTTSALHSSNHLDRSGRVVSANTIRALQFNQAEQLMMRQSGSASYRKSKPRPPFQQQQHSTAGSGMRVVFLDGTGSSTGSYCGSGTGVFLPRATGNPTESSRKPRSGCSTVLIPARVAQALMVHFDRLEARSRGGFSPQQYGERSEQYYFQQKSQPQVPAPAPARYDYDSNGLCLPQEWMY